MLKLKTDSLTPQYRPLDLVEVECSPGGTIAVRDGLGREYFRRRTTGALRFRAGGALGRHCVERLDSKGRVEETLNVMVDCQSGIDDAGGKFRRLLDMLHWTMTRRTETNAFWFQGRPYRFFVGWLRDHVHTLKGMKYFYGNLLDGIDLYADSQRKDGMIWDNTGSRTPDPNTWEWQFGYGDFIRKVNNDTGEFKRIPVENDVEYLFVEGLYYTWKATGDDEWMCGKLDAAIRAFDYSTSSPYRWSEKYRLLKRGYTIDTWDFQTAEDTAITGHAMVVHLGKSRFGIMHGDNTGFAIGCEYLAEMLDHAQRPTDASKYRKLGAQIRKRLDKVAWNGRFFTHHVPEDRSVKRDLGVDESTQVSLSNAYDLNRNITHEQCVEIIRTYQRIRKQMPKSSPGEFYQIFPPFQKGFGGHNSLWEYMNGGVTTIVAGELAHGAFEHGFEDYGVDILRRVTRWGEDHNGYFDCCLRGAMPKLPKRKFTTLSLKEIANVDFRGKGARGVPGWTGEGNNDLASMPTGRRTFCDVPFLVTDPAKNARRACLGLSSKPGYAQEATLNVAKKAASIYLLHTLAGGALAGVARIRYADGSEHVEYIQRDKHVGGWWVPTDPAKDRKASSMARVAWRGPNRHFPNVGVYACGLDNPHPSKKIREIRFEASEDETFWAVLAVTLSDKPVFFMPSDVSFGIPDNWGAAAVVYALIEGLAGLKDTGVAFDRAVIAPRWVSAGVSRVTATAKYEASGGYVRYTAAMSPKRITLEFTGSGEEFRLELLLPKGARAKSAKLDGAEAPLGVKRVERSAYACLEVRGVGPHKLVLQMG
jgi:hypothetical protein